MNNKAIDNMLSGAMNISILEIYNLIYGLDANNLLIERKNKKILFLIFLWYWYYIDLLWLLIYILIQQKSIEQNILPEIH